MDPLTFLLLLLGGALAGFLGLWLGLSEGLVFVPAILAIEQSAHTSSLVSTHIALGTSLSVVAILSWVGVYRERSSGQIVSRAAWVAGLASGCAAIGGSVFACGLEGSALQHLFALVVGVGVIRLFGESRKPKGEQKPRLEIPGLAGAGLLSGGFTSLTGVSSAFVAVPMLYSLRRFPLMKALGTARVIAAIAASAAVAAYVAVGRATTLLPDGAFGFVLPLYVGPLVLGAVAVGFVSQRIAVLPQRSMVRKLFAVLLLVILVRMLFF